MLVDSHCHIEFNDFEDDIEEIIQRMKDNGVTAALNAGNNIDSLDEQLSLSEKYPFIYISAGIHPHEVSNLTEKDMQELPLQKRYPFRKSSIRSLYPLSKTMGNSVS